MNEKDSLLLKVYARFPGVLGMGSNSKGLDLELGEREEDDGQQCELFTSPSTAGILADGHTSGDGISGDDTSVESRSVRRSTWIGVQGSLEVHTGPIVVTVKQL